METDGQPLRPPPEQQLDLLTATPNPGASALKMGTLQRTEYFMPVDTLNRLKSLKTARR